MKKTLSWLGVVALSLMLAGTAQGDPILDTGEAPNRVYAWALNASSQWVAGQFTITQAWDVGAMQGDIWTAHTDGMVVVTIYTNGNDNLPGTPLFTKSFQSQPVGYKGWQGTTGYAGHLDPGTYWIAFEAPGSTFQGGIGGYPWDTSTWPPQHMVFEIGYCWIISGGEDRKFPGSRAWGFLAFGFRPGRLGPLEVPEKGLIWINS
jgi:hypothetical protein